MAVFACKTVPCFKPLTAWRGPRLASGKRSVVFKVGSAEPALSAFAQKLPCGQCFGCRLDYSYDWAVRCVCEAQMHKQNCLILLTYAELPKNASLQLGDWRAFMKRLRRKVGPVRFFHAGEYGDNNARPHDHALLFGYDFPDKVFFKNSKTGFKLYQSAMLSRIWGKGHTTVAGMSFESAGYLARYLMDKPTLTRRVFDDNGVCVGRTFSDQAIRKYGQMLCKDTGELLLIKKPEYLTMSHNPGIGESWLRKYWSDVYPHDFVEVSGARGRMPPPRYFDNKVEEWNLVDMNAIKLHRMSRSDTTEEVWNKFLQKFQLLDLHRDERLAKEEVVKRAQLALYNSKRGDLYGD